MTILSVENLKNTILKFSKKNFNAISFGNINDLKFPVKKSVIDRFVVYGKEKNRIKEKNNRQEKESSKVQKKRPS
jgi:hypothetical protein